nr:MAG TPA: hypothetical protein [Caudoviricetes sp.]
MVDMSVMMEHIAQHALVDEQLRIPILRNVLPTPQAIHLKTIHLTIILPQKATPKKKHNRILRRHMML